MKEEQFTVVFITMPSRVYLLKQVIRAYDGRPLIKEFIVLLTAANTGPEPTAKDVGAVKTPFTVIPDSGPVSLNKRYAHASGPV
jgi:hypothetical protein